MNKPAWKSQKHRVLNLIARVDLTTAPIKRQAVIKLLKWQPLARRIRFAEKCHCKRGNLLSYQLPGEMFAQTDDSEQCGYFCPYCGFGAAGTRDIRKP